MNRLFGLTVAGFALALAGCAHTVPALTPDPGSRADLTVDDIVHHIPCEVVRAKLPAADSKRFANYLVTVLLTLQVDDSLDLTPSLGLTQPLLKPEVSLASTLNADLGGARRRVFTTSYSFDVSDVELRKSNSCVTSPKQKMLNLEGDLGIGDIVIDGLGSQDADKAIVLKPKDAADKSGPSFGSTVQFVVTKSITNFGPVWTLKYFKGPGGSNGLISGKRMDTDSILITFAPKPPPTKTAPDANKALEAALDKLADIIRQRGDALGQKQKALTTAHSDSARLNAKIGLLGARAKSKSDLETQFSLARDKEARAIEDVRSANVDLAASRASFEAIAAAKQSLDANAAASNDQSRSGAANASQQLQLNMLLQNLTVSH